MPPDRLRRQRIRNIVHSESIETLGGDPSKHLQQNASQHAPQGGQVPVSSWRPGQHPLSAHWTAPRPRLRRRSSAGLRRPRSPDRTSRGTALPHTQGRNRAVSPRYAGASTALTGIPNDGGWLSLADSSSSLLPRPRPPERRQCPPGHAERGRRDEIALTNGAVRLVCKCDRQLGIFGNGGE